ncbi:hypothetical protein LTR60_001918, partial [Cryomyces antarcticus]
EDHEAGVDGCVRDEGQDDRHNHFCGPPRIGGPDLEREEDVCVVAMTAGASEARVVTRAIEALSFENDHIKLALGLPRRTPKDPEGPRRTPSTTSNPIGGLITTPQPQECKTEFSVRLRDHRRLSG